MELQLPGDDPAAMATVCKILHFQYSQHPQADAIELDLLRNLAEICSKYKCAGPVSLVTNPWLLPLTSKVAEPGMHDVLAISYLLDDVACFKAASKTLVLEYTEPFESLNISLPFADSALVERKHLS